jgi:hypothetical protein
LTSEAQGYPESVRQFRSLDPEGRDLFLSLRRELRLYDRVAGRMDPYRSPESLPGGSDRGLGSQRSHSILHDSGAVIRRAHTAAGVLLQTAAAGGTPGSTPGAIPSEQSPAESSGLSPLDISCTSSDGGEGHASSGGGSETVSEGGDWPADFDDAPEQECIDATEWDQRSRQRPNRLPPLATVFEAGAFAQLAQQQQQQQQQGQE